MQYLVIRKFTCKLDHKRYRPGDTYETSDPDRAAFLIGMKRIEDARKPELIHVGGGMYELPDGRRIRGKDAAIEAMGGG